jgi:hypothetical protein
MDVPAHDWSPTSLTTQLAAERVKLLALGLLVVAAWIVLHPYPGLIADARIYTFLALARLHPQTLSHDVFVRFGSQDRYTVFSPIFAEAIRLLDLGRGAAVLTLLCEVAFYVGVYLLARCYMSPLSALLSVAFVVVLPSGYGSHHIFHFTEDFLSPRLPAEALTLAGVAAIVTSRHWLGGACLLAALVLHPIMASAGFALLASLYAALPRRRWISAACAGVLAVFALLPLVVRTGPFVRFDPEWLGAVLNSSPFLFVSNWSLEDWCHTALPLAVLGCGVLTSADERVRRLCASALIIAVGGLLLTWLYCDGMRLVLATEVQPWRWLWICTLIAIGFAPVIVRDCWQRGSAMRSVPLILASVLMLRSEPVSIALSAIALGGALGAGRIKNARVAQLAFASSIVLLIGASVDHFANLALYDALEFARERSGSIVLQEVMAFTHNGLPFAAALALIWSGSLRLRSTREAAALLAASVAILGFAAASPAASSWTTHELTSALRAKFADWRRQIPPQAEVAWVDWPLGEWYLLDRASYLSGIQMAGDVFSRRKSILLARRAKAFDRVLVPPGHTLRAALSDPTRKGNLTRITWIDAEQVAALCAEPALGFVVTDEAAGRSPFKPIALTPSKPHELVYLYRCADYRRAAPPGAQAGRSLK